MPSPEIAPCAEMGSVSNDQAYATDRTKPMAIVYQISRLSGGGGPEEDVPKDQRGAEPALLTPDRRPTSAKVTALDPVALGRGLSC